jgi:DNA-binding SARP family transcriptional activator
MEALINENKIEKAKEVIDISMTNMPIDQYGYYTLVEPFVDGYYKVGETTKARDLFNRLKTKYQERLNYYSETELDEQYDKIEDIISDMEAYRRNIDVLITNRDRDFVEKETVIFNEYIDKFAHFYKDDENQGRSSLEDLNSENTDSVSANDTTIQEETQDSTLVPVEN